MSWNCGDLSLSSLEQVVASANPDPLKKVIVVKLIKRQVENPLSAEYLSCTAVVDITLPPQSLSNMMPALM